MGRIVVVGSINMDIVVEVPRMPLPGETVAGSAVNQLPGGKGANQAVAASRADGQTVMVGAVGADSFADSLMSFLGSENLDTEWVSHVPGLSGTALITVDTAGENSIVIVAGANEHVSAEAVARFQFTADDVVLLQHEIPASTNESVVESARRAGARMILNTAPYRDPGEKLLQQLDYLITNEIEFAALLDEPHATMSPDLVTELLAGAPLTTNVVVTLGAAGVIARIDGEVIRIEGHQVPVRDTTGAGDCLCGAFAAALASGENPTSALSFANAAAAISVQTMGAGPSMPHKAEVEAMLRR